MDSKRDLPGLHLPQSTLAEILEIASRLRLMTSDPPEVEILLSSPKKDDAAEFWRGIEELVSAIIVLPVQVGFENRLAAMEAMSVRLACEECEYLFRESKDPQTADLDISLLRLDAALGRFKMLVG